MRSFARLAALAALAALFAAFGARAQAVAWSRAWNGPSGAAAALGDGYIIGRSLAADAAGNILATGTSGSGDAADFLTTKVDGATGNIVWQKPFAGTAGKEDDAMSVAADPSGNALVAGLTFDASGNIAIKVIKYAAADGTIAWQATLAGAPYNAPFVIASDAAGNAIVGAETNASGTSDLRIAKLAAANGATLWDKTLDGGHDDFMSDLVVDGSGNVVVAAISANNAGNDDWAILKLDATSGAQLWKRTYDGGAADDAFSIALDNGGNAFVTGSTQKATADMLTLKVNAADGSIAWQQPFDGGKEDAGQAVMVDASGNAIVAGQAQNAAGNFDYVVTKYAAADGKVLWRKTWDGGADDWAYNVALDAAGNAYVAGGTTTGGSTDWMTVAFAAADGSVLFQAPYKGSAGQADDAYEVVATKDGVVVGGIANETGAQPGVHLMKLALATSGGTGTGTGGTGTGTGGTTTPSVNVAAASAGGVATASSSYSASYPPSAAINGDRTGSFGKGGVWLDATRSAFPDWLQVQFAGARAIDHVVVYSMQDNYNSPVEPTDTLTFSRYGVVSFQVQGWNGAAWTTLATVTGNNLVKRTVTFTATTTDRIRVVVNGALGGSSRLAEVEAWTPGTSTGGTGSNTGGTGGTGTGTGGTGTGTGTGGTGTGTGGTGTGTGTTGAATDVAAASAGATASASSSYSTGYPASAAINGDHTNRGGIWMDATRGAFPDWVQVTFPAPHAIDHIVLYSMQDNYTSTAEPGDTLTFTRYGIVDFDVQAWNGAAWTTVASVKGNNLVKRTVSFAPTTTDRIRVVVKNALGGYSRVVELEAWGS